MSYLVTLSRHDIRTEKQTETYNTVLWMVNFENPKFQQKITIISDSFLKVLQSIRPFEGFWLQGIPRISCL